MPKNPDTNLVLPCHVALIMDGNRRWAKQRGLSSIEGHKAGEKVIEPTALKMTSVHG